MAQDLYTYRAGKKVFLEKEPDQFVVRASEEELRDIGITEAEKVSSNSSRVTTRASDLEPTMSRARHLAPTHHAYKTADTGNEFLITDRVFVKFRQPLSQEDVSAFAGRYGLVVANIFGDRDYLFQLTDHTGMNPVKLVVTLTEQEPQVEIAEHDLNHRMSKYQLALPTDPFYEREWHLHSHFTHQEVDPRSSAQCEEAWRLLDSYGVADVVVGVTDDGCKLDHGDFNSPNKFAGWGYLRGSRLIVNNDIDANPAEMYKPGANHGSSCAGVIAGEVDAAMIVGAAPGCRLLPIQWESSGPSLFISDSKMLTVLNYVASRVDILSNSWGGVPDNTWALPVVHKITQLAQNGGRRGRGIVFLWAAGNENCPIQHSAGVNVPYTHGWDFRADGSMVWIGVETARNFTNNLVGIPGVMHVAALASNAQRSHYSNYGTGIGISAPTNNVHSYYRLEVSGLGVITATGDGSGVTERFGGTSSATPLVAGVAALVISANPDLSGVDVISILKRTASKNLSMDAYPRTPPAVYDREPNWDVSPVAPFNQGDFADINHPDGTWSPWFGHGRVDAAAAVAEAIRRRAPSSQQTLRQASSPARAIADHTTVTDTISFPQTATAESAKVTVDISHTFIGDLIVTLQSPSGVVVTLHNRNGGGADNLRRTYDLVSTPALSALTGQSVKGDWTLKVQDKASGDKGVLNRWELEIKAQEGGPVEAQETPGVAIPDNNNAGLERTLSVNAGGRVKDIEVTLDITHTYIGDLLVQLVSPAGTSVTLHNRAGGSSDNLIKTYTMATTTGLQTLRGQNIEGQWKLKVADQEAVDMGKLNRWSLKITREA